MGPLQSIEFQAMGASSTLKPEPGMQQNLLNPRPETLNDLWVPAFAISRATYSFLYSDPTPSKLPIEGNHDKEP